MTSATNLELQIAQSLPQRDDYRDALSIEAPHETQLDILPSSTAIPRLHTDEFTETDRRVQGSVDPERPPATKMLDEAPVHIQSQHPYTRRAISSQHEIRSEPSPMSALGFQPSAPTAFKGQHNSPLDGRDVEMQSVGQRQACTAVSFTHQAKRQGGTRWRVPL